METNSRLNKQINIPTFKLWHLIVFISFLILIILNIGQWYFNKDNNILNKQLKERNEVIDFKLDSIKKINIDLVAKDILQDTIISIYKSKRNNQINIRKKNEDVFNKNKQDYSNLNYSERDNKIKSILSEHE